jgi:hypothetical protein
MLASLQQYLPLDDLAKIILATLLVAVIAPAAVSVAIAGLDRRATSLERHTSPLAGITLVATGVAVIAALIGAGLYTLFTD